MEYRWIEIQFYYICQDLLALNQNILDVLDFIQYSDNITPFNANIVSECAQRILTQPIFRPTREEIIVLGAQAKVKMIDIKRRIGINNRDYYLIFDTAMQDPPYFYPRFTHAELDEINIFVKFANKFKEVGI